MEVSLSISPILDDEERMIGLSKIVRDITQQKLEETRKNDFVALVSHELKTPLTSILAYGQLLLGKAENSEDQFTKNALIKMVAQSKKMVTMIQDFLNIGRLEEGKIQLKLEQFEINELVHQIVEDMILIHPSSELIFIRCEHLNVMADRDKIGQVINNLIGNAIKYSPSALPIHIVCGQDENTIKLEVIDQGIGISKKEQGKLFNRYYRAEDEDIKNISGFGIGLYLSNEIMKLHDSRIEVESDKGKGATFWLTLPVLSSKM
ncbi:MAG: HAMP domain-containing histidine kinase [Flavobacteriales bacterium]|nr:MAG: HAMP domain-containing histidine kinase [Flavobacteriales bacterium]